MAILVDKGTRVLIQGITGKVGSLQAKLMKEYGTQVLAGVTPGKGGTSIEGIPVYDFVEEALKEHHIDAAMCFVPARFARDAAMEIIEGGIPFLVLTTEGIPDRDILDILGRARDRNAAVLGPDTPGIISPGKCKLGVHPNRMFMEGRVGVLSRSGSLSYEIGRVLTANGIGQSTVVGIGGGPFWGLPQREVIRMFQEDPETDIIVMLGEVGGTMEHEAAAFIANNVTKPVISLIVGRSAPEGAQMGHAGAIIEGDEATAESKARALKKAGSYIAQSPSDIVRIINQIRSRK